MRPNFHEDLHAHSRPRGGSDRQFGLVFAVVFTAIGLWPVPSGAPVRWPALGIAAAFLAVTLVRPAVLHPLNRLWMRFGLLLGRIVNPAVTALLFFAVFTPVGLLARWLGKDPLRLQREPRSASYWIPRQSAGSPRETLKKQF